jgi:hypothetical protein
MYRKIPDSGVDKKEALEYAISFVSRLVIAGAFAFIIWKVLVFVNDSSTSSTDMPSMVGKAVSYNSTLGGLSPAYLLAAIAVTAAGAYAAINYQRLVKPKSQHRRLQDL